MATNELLHGMDGQWTDSFVLDGESYYCNHVNPHPLHRTGGVIMDSGSDDCATTDGDSNIIVMPAKRELAAMTFAVFTINQYIQPVTDDKIVLGYYRKGKPKPIYYQEHNTSNNDILVTLDNYQVEPGEYFLAMGNIAPYDHLSEKYEKTGNFYVYRIRIVEHGQYAQHPILLGANIDNDLLLNLMFHYEKDVTTEHLSCECYDADFRMVTEPQVMSCPDIFNNSASVQLKNSGWWIDGDYHVIVYHNREPYAHVRFVTQDGESNVVWEDCLSKEDIFYKLCKDVQKTGKKHMFCKLNGCGKLKKKVLDYLCSEHEHVNEHLMFAASGKPDYELMFHVTGIMHPYYGYQTFTVKALMKEAAKVNDPQETLDAMMARRSTVIYDLDELTKPKNEGFARMLLDIAADRHGFIVLYGTMNELKRVLNVYPEWMDYLMTPSWWNVYTYTERDALRTVEDILRKKNLVGNWLARDKFEEVIHENWDMLKTWLKADYQQWIEMEIMRNIKQRVFNDNSFSEMFLKTVMDADVTLTLHTKHTPESFGYCLSGLERMVGLRDVKDHLKLLLKRMDFDRKREKLGLRKIQSGMPHMVFTGNPGTGKTTVAKLVGQAFKELGYLTKGDVITVERSQMIGRHIGSTEARMTELLKKAKGNVLFIDEAYSLCDNNEGDRKDFGCRVLECLLPILAEPDSDIIVILAGYEKEMNEMMSLNPGMKGRFPFWFKFEDYDSSELHEIAKRLLEDCDYTLSEGASKKLKWCIDEMLKSKDRFFHNARWIHQLVQDGILAMMAERLYDTEPTEMNRTLFRTVTEDDVSRGYKRVHGSRKSVERRKVGFR